MKAWEFFYILTDYKANTRNCENFKYCLQPWGQPCSNDLATRKSSPALTTTNFWAQHTFCFGVCNNYITYFGYMIDSPVT